MAEENENVVEEVTEQQENTTVEKTEQPRNDLGQFESKFKSAKDDSIIKVDLSKPPSQSEEVEQQPAEEDNVDVVEDKPEAVEQQVQEKVEEEVVEEETPVVEEITVEDTIESKDEVVETVEEVVEEAVAESKETGKPLPENIQKLVDFMEPI